MLFYIGLPNVVHLDHPLRKYDIVMSIFKMAAVSNVVFALG